MVIDSRASGRESSIDMGSSKSGATRIVNTQLDIMLINCSEPQAEHEYLI